MNPIELVHDTYIHSRRVRVLCQHLQELIPQGARVLDVGCGDGLLAKLIGLARPDIEIRGIDTLMRKTTQIPVEPFDGTHIPYPDDSFDIVMFVDVLHHIEDPLPLLREAVRVSRGGLLLKDHLLSGFLAKSILTFMDSVGNARYSVQLPNNYWNKKQWSDAFEHLHLTCETWKGTLRLYPFPLDWLFGRSLHFVARLR